MCIREQRRDDAGRTLSDMHIGSIKATVTIVWVLAAWGAGMAGGVGSLSGWALLAGAGLLPPLVMTWRWHDPRQTTSEAIQKALR